jgi:hypothetical protein
VGCVAGFGVAVVLVGLAVGFGLGLGAGAGAGLAAGAGVVGAADVAVSADGRSLSVALVSTGASWRSRFRLSADATSRRSPRPQATTVASVSVARTILDIDPSLR